MTDFEKGRLVRAAEHVTIPGAVTKKGKPKRRTMFAETPREEVDLCLSCPYTTCLNCLKNNRSATLRKKFDIVLACRKEKMSIAASCRTAGICKKSFFNIINAQ